MKKANKIFKNQLKRILLEMVLGILLSVGLCALIIYLGYSNAYSEYLSEYTLKIIGIPIYLLKLTNNQYVGTALNQNMSIFGIICSMVLVLLCESIIYIRKKVKAKR